MWVDSKVCQILHTYYYHNVIIFKVFTWVLIENSGSVLIVSSLLVNCDSKNTNKL